MRKKYKEYELEPTLAKLPPEIKASKRIYFFTGAWNQEAKMTLTAQGYEAIMKKDGKHFTECWWFDHFENC